VRPVGNAGVPVDTSGFPISDFPSPRDRGKDLSAGAAAISAIVYASQARKEWGYFKRFLVVS